MTKALFYKLTAFLPNYEVDSFRVKWLKLEVITVTNRLDSKEIYFLIKVNNSDRIRVLSANLKNKSRTRSLIRLAIFTSGEIGQYGGT